MSSESVETVSTALDSSKEFKCDVEKQNKIQNYAENINERSSAEDVRLDLSSVNDDKSKSNGPNIGKEKDDLAIASDKSEELALDLTNPDALVQQLEKVELTDEDTEELLHEAYKVNMKLKEILRRQEAKERNRLSSAKSAYAALSRPHRPLGTAVLPPISRGNKQSHSSSSMQHDHRPSSSKKQHEQRRKSGSSKSAKERPAWDDR